MAMKVGNFLRQFRGNGDDFEAFWEKFLVLARLQKWDTDEKKMNHLPLFLDGDAFLVFRKLSDDDKDAAVVKGKLQQAFAVSKSQA